MGLEFDLTKINDYEIICYDELGKVKPITELLIFATMQVGLGAIAAGNAAEFYGRMMIVHKLGDIGIVMPGQPRPLLLEPEHVYKHIGLRTNVPDDTRSVWIKRMFGSPRNRGDEDTSLVGEYVRKFKQDQRVLERSGSTS